MSKTVYHETTRGNGFQSPPQLYVLGFMFNAKKENVVLLEKKKPIKHRGLLNGVGGKVEPEDDDHTATMVREFREETGVLTEKSDWTYYACLTHEDFTIYCYFGVNEDHYHEARSVEKEEVCKRCVDNIRKSESVNHLKWLLEMAVVYGNDKSFATVELW